MRNVLTVALQYFCVVFAVGFLLGTIRVVFLVKPLGERLAELAEMPFMVIAVALAAKFLVNRHRHALSKRKAVYIGVVALAILLTAEFTVVLTIRGISISEYIASRDPVSGLAYLAVLLFYALAPAMFYGPLLESHK